VSDREETVISRRHPDELNAYGKPAFIAQNG
jgi:hypothetical protein